MIFTGYWSLQFLVKITVDLVKYNFLILCWQNPWDVINFSGNTQIHLDSFLSAFNISGLPEEYYHNSKCLKIPSLQICRLDDIFIHNAPPLPRFNISYYLMYLYVQASYPMVRIIVSWMEQLQQQHVRCQHGPIKICLQCQAPKGKQQGSCRKNVVRCLQNFLQVLIKTSRSQVMLCTNMLVHAHAHTSM